MLRTIDDGGLEETKVGATKPKSISDESHNKTVELIIDTTTTGNVLNKLAFDLSHVFADTMSKRVEGKFLRYKGYTF